MTSELYPEKWVEGALLRAIENDVEVLAQAGQHVVQAGGKRLRPRVVLLSYQAAGGRDLVRAVPLAVVTELLHTASLVHDDINDRSSMRRGQDSVNGRWGDGLALLVGDFVFVRALSMLAGYEARVIRGIADCCTAIIEGETLQMLSLGDLAVNQETYLEIVGKKTAALFAACAELGAVVAGATEVEIAACRQYGFNLGIAFQIRDDLLDVVGHSQTLGKPVASDLEQGKVSLASVCCMARSAQAVEAFCTGDRERMGHLLHETGALEYAMQQAHGYAERARKALRVLPESGAVDALCRLAGLAVVREI